MVHWLILVAAASCLVMLVVVLLARNGWWRWRPHINEGILSTVERHKPVVAAHRGGGYPFGPENTLYSYRRSVYECGAHILEIDVRLTKDKQLVLVHDARLDRTTNGQGLVGEYTLEELKKLDARAKFRKHNIPIQPLADGSMDDPRLFQIPTLEEVFDEFAGCADVIFFLDMKDTGAVAQTIELINERKLENRIIFGSVAPGPNQAVRRLKPEGVPVGPDVVSVLFMNFLSRLRLFWLYPHKHEVVGIIHSASLSAFIPPRGIKGKLLGLAEYVLLGGGGRLVNERLVRDVRRSGRMFAVFGVEMSDPVLIRECLDMGVEIIFSDSPDVARDTINKWKRERQPSHE